MNESDAILQIKQFFSERNRFVYTNQRNNEVICKKVDDGIEVDCLNHGGHKNFLPWGVFRVAVSTLNEGKGSAIRGDAHSKGSRLGDHTLPLDSVEGRIAHIVYGKAVGDSCFQRISPVARILIESGICINQRGDLELAN